MALIVFTERFILYLLLICYICLGNRLTSDVVFSTAQLINSIQLFMCVFFPRALSTYAEAEVTITKLEDFLLLEENQEMSKEIKESSNNDAGIIKIEKASASWFQNPVVDTLININLTIPPGSLL